ncbi:MAG: Metallo-beta-lactamase superfamily protein [Actinomycetota bacterium]|nr:Metallo-beta-lactamase superfamily protein [Actinomycetota bacterium]
MQRNVALRMLPNREPVMVMLGVRVPRDETVEATEILPDVWMVGGYLSDNFFLAQPSSNAYVLRDDDVLTIVDPGVHHTYRKKILDLVEEYRSKGVKKVRMLVTQGHFDHSGNCDLVLQAGLPWEFLLPEVEFPTMNAAADFLNDLDALAEYEDVFRTMFVRTPAGPVLRGLASVSPSLARSALRSMANGVMGSGNDIACLATLLRSDQKITRTFGSVSLSGWQAGRLFLVHDGSHSPGHLCVFDEQNKLMIAGDTTIEINPAFFYSSMQRLQDVTGAMATMAREGAIEIVVDGHRSARYFPRVFEACGVEPLDPLQLIDFASGRSECEAFLAFYHRYYQALVRGVHEAHRRAGRATVGEIVEELRASTDPYVRFKTGIPLTRLPSRDDVLVAGVLKEAGAAPLHVEGRIIVDPVPG